MENNRYNLWDCPQLDYEIGIITFEVYIADFDWVCELLDYDKDPDNTRTQLLEFYNMIRDQYPEVKDYPEYN